jgi:hypothetical protein
VNTKEALKDQLELLTDGLLFPSESDYPFVWQELTQFAGLPSCDQLSQAFQNTCVLVNAKEWFERYGTVQDYMDHQQKKTARAIAKLGRSMHKTYDQVQVYRIQDEGPEVQIYILGINKFGVTGLSTISIET